MPRASDPVLGGAHSPLACVPPDRAGAHPLPPGINAGIPVGTNMNSCINSGSKNPVTSTVFADHTNYCIFAGQNAQTTCDDNHRAADEDVRGVTW